MRDGEIERLFKNVKKLLLIVLSLASLASHSPAGVVRKWNVAGNIIEGEMISIEGDRVTIKKKKGTAVVPLISMEQEDRDFVAAEVKARAEKAALAEAAAKLRKSDMAKAVAGSTYKLDGKKLKSCDVFTGRAPEYYLLYWAGGWSTPCREAAPQFATEYDESLAKKTSVATILLSCDESRERMQEFMNDMKLNFPAMMLERWQRVKLLKALEPPHVPAWKLVDASGTVIAEGEAAKTKAKELGASSGAAAAEKKQP